MPQGLPVRGLTAGSGPVKVAIYMDLSDPSDAATYLSVTAPLLERIAADRSAKITFKPVVTRKDTNSIEAALAVLAASRQNRTWCVTAQVANLRTRRGGDWINPTVLRGVAKTCKLSRTRFLRDATTKRLYSRLNSIRRQARKDRIGATPSYVIKGAGASRTVRNPSTAEAVATAIAGNA